jgi:hypothetical protein
MRSARFCWSKHEGIPLPGMLNCENYSEPLCSVCLRSKFPSPRTRERCLSDLVSGVWGEGDGQGMRTPDYQLCTLCVIQTGVKGRDLSAMRAAMEAGDTAAIEEISKRGVVPDGSEAMCKHMLEVHGITHEQREM